MHPSTQSILRYFDSSHLPPAQQAVARPIEEIAQASAETLEGPELGAGLRKLLEAKDCLVRASLDTSSHPHSQRRDTPPA